MVRIAETCAEVNVPDAPSGWSGALTSIAVPLEWLDRVVLPEISR